MIHPTVDKRPSLLGQTLLQLQDIMQDLGQPGYRARQLARWIYASSVTNIGEMSNLSLDLRARLEDRFCIGLSSPLEEHRARDGTIKYLFPVAAGHCVESACIPDQERTTLCLSTQVGCRIGCPFCHTGRQGLQANLSPGGILNQLLSLPQRDRITNIVYMGMGEPLDNLSHVLTSLEIACADWGLGFSPRRITVSSVGLLPQLEQLINSTRVHIAVSLHSPFQQERETLVPAAKANPLPQLLATLRRHDWSGRRRLTFEYVVLAGVNDSERHARALHKLVHGLPCRINLLGVHPFPGQQYARPSPEEMQSFQHLLERPGLPVTIRRSRGTEVGAACGLLSTAQQKREQHGSL